jgi:hypothetical protein
MYKRAEFAKELGAPIIYARLSDRWFDPQTQVWLTGAATTVAGRARTFTALCAVLINP